MDEIIVTDPDPAWPLLYAQESERLRDVFGDALTAIAHVGSTSVPGLAAKPVIDLMVCVRSLDEARESVIGPLEALGYAYWLQDTTPGRLFFVRGLPPNGPRTHHLHIVADGDDQWQDSLNFRDYLRAHPDEARRYEELKRDLAGRFRHRREEYTNGKSEYILGVIQKARSLKK